MTTKRTLAEHIGDALSASARRVLAEHPEQREAVAAFMETAHERVVIVPTVDRDASGRIDTRSYALDVYLRLSQGLVPLCTVRRRELAMPPGHEDADPRAEARDLLDQNGAALGRIPDTPAALFDDGQANQEGTP
ncbi:hypothetical protein ABN034_09345 [Actinopolymorpha sp. B11F2]|uniref:hypothetical protein n=1 Tax=Actinopolymorpha sp. B11F2 TaxID=3160862 RepID=UPI0032E406C6